MNAISELYKKNYIELINSRGIEKLPDQEVIDSDVDLAVAIWNNFDPVDLQYQNDSWSDDENYRGSKSCSDKYSSIQFTKTFEKHLENKEFWSALINKNHYDLLFVDKFKEEHADVFKKIKNNQDLIDYIVAKDPRGKDILDLKTEKEIIDYYKKHPKMIDQTVLNQYNHDKELCLLAIESNKYNYIHVSEDIKNSPETFLELLKKYGYSIYKYFSNEIQEHEQIKDLYIDQICNMKVNTLSLQDFSQLKLKHKAKILTESLNTHIDIISQYIGKNSPKEDSREFLNIVLENFVENPRKYMLLLKRKNVFPHIALCLSKMENSDFIIEKFLDHAQNLSPDVDFGYLISQIGTNTKIIKSKFDKSTYFNIYNMRQIEHKFIKAEEQFKTIMSEIFTDMLAKDKETLNNKCEQWFDFLLKSCTLDLIKSMGEKRSIKYQFFEKDFLANQLSTQLETKETPKTKRKI